jgi:hypothetical protein
LSVIRDRSASDRAAAADRPRGDPRAPVQPEREAVLEPLRGARRVAAPDSGDLEEIAVEEVALTELLRATRDGGVAVLSVAAAIGLAAARLAEG